ncbi:MAG: hypothetical protein FJ090_02525 [Deltaproteobacteria bacterium]|nr:hypothetical protein [Deltaproteobacteria bacterium]MBM4389975.1 hypothetical protein [Deltaproteobacteria bacterium]
MARTPAPRKRNKSSRHRAKLKAKHTKQRMRAKGLLQKRGGGRRLRR